MIFFVIKGETDDTDIDNDKYDMSKNDGNDSKISNNDNDKRQALVSTMARLHKGTRRHNRPCMQAA